MSKKPWLIIPIILALFFAGCLGAERLGEAIRHSKEVKKWNNGICSKCGGTYTYQQAIGHHCDTNYIYICDSCGKLIEVDTYYG